MTAHAKRLLFAKLVGRLLVHADAIGITVQLGEAFRPPETAALYAKQGRGIAKSLHTDKLAIDLLVFHGATYVSDGSAPEYAALGAYWKTLHADCRWGGDFSRPDPGHFSITHDGRA